MGILFLLIIGVAVYLIYDSVNKTSTSSAEKPLEILKKRYAGGEISHDQYEQIKKDLA
ncbi:MAG: SHOCT domain-containing protein [Syntrophomonas sp.]